MTSKTTRRRYGYLLTYIVVFAALVFFISPFVWILYTSFRPTDLVTTSHVITPVHRLTLTHYRIVLEQTDFPLFFLNSLIIATSVTVVSVLFSVLGAYGLSRFPLKGKNALIMGIFSTQMFPKVLLLIPIYNLVFAIGLFDTKVGVIAAQLILVLPFAVWMLKGYFDNLPRQVEDSARIDGCNLMQILWRIILPIAAPGIFVAAFYSFVVSWGDYLVVSVVSQSSRTATLTLVLQRLSSALQLRWGQVAAATVLTIVPTVILFAFVQRWLVTGLTAGASKG